MADLGSPRAGRCRTPGLGGGGVRAAALAVPGRLRLCRPLADPAALLRRAPGGRGIGAQDRRGAVGPDPGSALPEQQPAFREPCPARPALVPPPGAPPPPPCRPPGGPR